MSAAAALAKEDSSKIRKRIQDISKRLLAIRDEADHSIVELTNLVHRVQKEELFKEWKDPATKKLYRSFQSWIHAEVGISRAQVYRLIDVKELLKLPGKTLEDFGSSKCFELVRVAKEKPKLLGKMVENLKKNPDTPLYAVQQMVTNAVATGHFDSGKYQRWDAALKVEDAETVHKAFTVMQAIEPNKNPETASSRGLHLITLCTEFLQEKEPLRILKKLEEAGAFTNGNIPFRIEE